MPMKQLAWLFVAAILFSGCTGDDDANALPPCDELTHYIDAMGDCVQHVEPTMVIEGLPSTVEQFAGADFGWRLDNGTRQAVHSMDSRIRASLSNDPVTNETGPDDWGMQVTGQQHKDFPDAFNATFVSDEVGMFYLKGYMLIDAKNIWVDLGTIDVTAVSASGSRTPITASGLPPALDDSEVGITVGDGVTFDNQLQYDLTLSWTCTNGVTPEGGTVSAGSTLNVDFTMLTSCSFTLNSPLIVTGNDPSAMNGKVVVSRP